MKNSGSFQNGIGLQNGKLNVDNNKVNPQMIELARQSRGLNQSEFASLLGYSQANVSKIEQGFLSPSDEIMQKISSVLRYPLSLFKESLSIYPAVSFHRKRESLSTKVRGSIHAQINLTKMHVEKLLKSIELVDKLPNLSEKGYATPQEAAKALRAYWKIPSGPIDNLTETIEYNGGIIIHLDIDTTNLDGVSLKAANLPPIIFLNGNISADRMRFTLAHELGHAVLHELPNPDQELEANQFASEFLMPEDQIRNDLQNLTIRKLAELKKYWKVSMAALVFRAKDLSVITEHQSRYLFIQLAKLGYKKNEPHYFMPEYPKLIKQIVKIHLNQLGYTEYNLADMVNLDIEEFTTRYTDIPETNKLKLVRGTKE